jgi:hypothetical protein
VRRHRTILASVLSLSSALAGCAVDATGNPDGERTSRSSEAIGGTVNTVCTPASHSDQLQIESVEADPDGHMQVRLCVPFPASYFLIQDTAVGGGYVDYDNESGTLDLYGRTSGAHHAFIAEACDSLIGGPADCLGWTAPSFVYNPFAWTLWTDTDQVTGTAPYDSALPVGTESMPDGSTRTLVSCAVMFHGTTQVGKGVRDAPGLCFFGWAGGEQIIGGSMVLQGASRPLVFQQWLPAANFLGVNPVRAGLEPNNTEYVCRAPLFNPVTGKVDTLPGKTVGSTCNVSWGGNEFPVDPATSFVEILNEE